jgi:hypothetical protein
LKIAHLLAQYLYQNKKMQLQGIGEFFIDNVYENSLENEKGKNKVPENAIRFIANKKCGEDNELIAFIAAATKKIKPLASSDVEDFLTISKQLLNVSKQLYIEGLGTLILNDKDNVEFLQGNEIYISPAVDENVYALKTKPPKENQHEDFDFKNNNYPGIRSSSANTLKKVVVTIAFAAGLFILVYIGWYFFRQWKEGKNFTQTNIENIKPVLALPNGQADTLTAAKPAVSVAETITAAADTYDIIIETAKKNRALYRITELQKMGYPVKLSTSDSVAFHIYTTINGSIADSSKALDSISKFFGRKAKLLSNLKIE